MLKKNEVRNIGLLFVIMFLLILAELHKQVQAEKNYNMVAPAKEKYYIDNDEKSERIKAEKQGAILRTKIVKKNAEKTKPFFIALEVKLSVRTQYKIFAICKKRKISFAFVMAIINQESSFRIKSIGDHGHAFGLMQIQPRWHRERIQRLKVSNLLDPIDNVKVGIDYLIEIFKKNDDVDHVLMSYNLGTPEANRLWKRGIHHTEYSKTILKTEQKYERYIERRCVNG